MNRSNTQMKYCADCGGRVSLRTPEGDHLQRHVCEACGAIHYRNPRLVVGCVPELDGRILLCKRAIEPRRGYWTVPAGFMENGETLEEGAMREAMEEAHARVEIEELYTVFSVPHISQVHMMFRARLANDDFRAGIESLEVKLVTAEEIPWQELAFTVVRRTLEHFLEDRARGAFVPHFGEIRAPVR